MTLSPSQYRESARVELPWPSRELSPNARVHWTKKARATSKGCSIEGCDRPHEARGYCDPHYKRWLRHGDPLAGRKPVGTVELCSIDGCQGVVQSRGWCEKHYSRWRKNGDPLQAKPVSAWSEEDDAFLADNHGKMSLQAIADLMGRSRSSLRARVTRLGISKYPYWTPEEEARLVALYTKAGADGVLGLEALAREMGRDAGNLSRKAKELGLPTNLRRRVVEERKIRRPKYATEEERRAANSASRKKWHQENEHPRGFQGRHHSEAARVKISRASKAAQLFLTEDQRAERTMKAMKTRRANSNGSAAPKVARGSWKAGWREIGGKRNYYRSRWEANYARYLQWLKDAGEIRDWQHEPETFWFEAIKRGVRSYLPDFRVWENDGRSELHEVKGWMDQRSRTTLKRMAKYHPQERIILIDGRQYRAIRLKVMGLVPGWEDAPRDSRA